MPTVAPLALLLLAACGSEPLSAPPQIPPAEVVWKVRAPIHAVTLAVGDTYELPVTVLNVFHDTLPVGPGQLAFTSLDTTTVHINETGRVTASAATPPGAPTRIVTSLVAHGVTRADTVYVTVTSTRLPIASISVQPLPGDSARMSLMAPMFLRPRALDADGNPVAGPYIHLIAERPQSVILQPAFGLIFSYAPGKQWIYAETNAYGTVLRDSLELEFLYAAALEIPITSPEPGILAIPPELSNHTIFVQRCALIQWRNATTEAVNIVFDTPGNTGTCTPDDETGNAMNVAPGTTLIRKFPNAGVTKWTLRRSASPNTVLTTSSIEAK